MHKNLPVEIHPCSLKDFEAVQRYVNELHLDNREMQYHQFVVAFLKNTIIGFGRIREYDDSAEICSVGVLEPFRNKGVGKKLVYALIDNFYQNNKFNRKNLYVVTIIPPYFEKFGFEITEQFPKSINDKLQYCISHLSVPEKYAVMMLTRPQSNLSPM